MYIHIYYHVIIVYYHYHYYYYKYYDIVRFAPHPAPALNPNL